MLTTCSRRFVPFRKLNERDSFLRQVRYFTDDFYPWGRDKRSVVGELVPGERRVDP